MSITKAITAIAGVGHVEADLKNGTVTVTHDESTGAGSIIAEIEKIGFEVRE
jgi:copper chaperone CopZ